MKIEVSNGEIIDKMTILQLKLERIKDGDKLKNLRKEYEALKDMAASIMKSTDPLYKALYEINRELWDIEDRIRELERNRDFGEEFVATARAVYIKNDKRAEIKKEINLNTSSDLIEEKSYRKY